MEDTRADPSSSSLSSLFDNLPTQILLEILSTLPIRTLLTCRCVCKSWLLLTSDTDFAKLLSTRAITEILLEHPDETMFSTDLALGEFETRHSSVSRVQFNVVFQIPRFSVGSDNNVSFGETHSVCLVNSCHGFLCCRGLSNKFAVIWNPITDQFIAFPAPREIFIVINYAFGFSPKANKFKLLRMVCAIDPVTGRTSSKDMAEVFTFGKSEFSWRIVDYCPDLHPDIMPRVFVEAAIHWVIEDSDPNGIVIVSFDFDSEQFRNVPLPPHLRAIKMDQVRIGALGGCLSLTDFSFGSCINIWVMKEYGVQDSWTKAFSIEKRLWFELINYMENGEILMLRRTGVLVAYDPAMKSFRSIGRAPSPDFKAVAYSPSLLRLEDPMMANLAYGLDVKLSLTNHCKDEMCAPAVGEEGQERLDRMGLVQSPVSMKRNSMEALREELRKKCEEQKLQQNK